MKRTAIWISVLIAFFIGFCLCIQLLFDMVGCGLSVCSGDGTVTEFDSLFSNLYWSAGDAFHHPVVLIALSLMGLYAVWLWVDRPLKLENIGNLSDNIRKSVLESVRFGGPAEALAASDQTPQKTCPNAMIARAIMAEVSRGKERGSNAIRMQLAGRRAYRTEVARLNRGVWILRPFMVAAPMIALMAAGLDVIVTSISIYQYPDDRMIGRFDVMHGAERGAAIGVYGIVISLGCLFVYSFLSHQVRQIEQGMNDFADELIGVCLLARKIPKAKADACYVSTVARQRRLEHRSATKELAARQSTAADRQLDEPENQTFSIAGSLPYEANPHSSDSASHGDSGFLFRYSNRIQAGCDCEPIA